ncbi:MAG: hypothetical protein K4305_08995 [Chlorobium sp.]|uniref:hypothetical protein n=1 Tax=Chlorobium sp. TaxID=1095 RepID=UPI002F4054BF
MKQPTYLFHKTEGMKLFDAASDDMKALRLAGWCDSPVAPEPEKALDWPVSNIKDGDVAVIEGVNNGKPVVLRVPALEITAEQPVDPVAPLATVGKKGTK